MPNRTEFWSEIRDLSLVVGAVGVGGFITSQEIDSVWTGLGIGGVIGAVICAIMERKTVSSDDIDPRQQG
ncbi:MAG: hypothetical protein JWO47_769 [Candidatus Saccharibacteria bacterium]|nr:hypothetical protein [Candidatus Saccharibacteria bacterium]